MNGIILFAGALLFLWLGRSIFIPLLAAVFLWYLINAIASYYRKIMPYNAPHNQHERRVGIVFNWVSSGLALVTLGGLIYLFITQVRPMFAELMAVTDDGRFAGNSTKNDDICGLSVGPSGRVI